MTESNVKLVALGNEVFELTDTRIEALLHGRVPISNPIISKAYLQAYVTVAITDEEGENFELQPVEVLAMLRHGGNARRLALQMLGTIECSEAGEEALVELANAGLIEVLMETIDDLMKDIKAAYEDSEPSAPVSANLISDFDCAARAFKRLMDPDTYCKCPGLNSRAVTFLGTLSSPASYIASVTLLEAAHQDSAISTSTSTSVPSLAVASSLIMRTIARIFLFSNGHTTEETIKLINAAIYQDHDTIDKTLTAMALAPRTEVSTLLSIFLENTADDYKMCDVSAFLKCSGKLIDMISSTSHDEDTLEGLVKVMCSLMEDKRAPQVFIEQGALSYLQPLLVSKPSVMVIQAVKAAALLSVNEAALEPSRSETIELIMKVLRFTVPGTIKSDDERYEPGLNLVAEQLTNESSQTHVKLAILHVLCADFAGSCGAFNVSVAVKVPKFVAAIRYCAALKDAFVYTCSVFILSMLGLALPFYKEHGLSENELDVNTLSKWTIAQVCRWVAGQPFRVHTAMFRDSLINGRMLIEMTDDDLVAVGISNPLHRRAILHSVADLVEEGKQTTSSNSLVRSVSQGGTGSTGSVKAEAGVDVFLSYRRDGGSDFAQLLKIVLSEAGLNVFLDVENLGSGVFDDKLWTTLRKAKTVCMVWSKGCLDRMITEDPATSTDFVRKEYALALQLGLHIVPVKHESFQFPDPTKLPEDVRKVMSYNAVPWSGAYREASAKKLIEQLGFTPPAKFK